MRERERERERERVRERERERECVCVCVCTRAGLRDKALSLMQCCVLYTEASDTCIGAVLTQQGEDEYGKEVEKPVHFLFHRLSNTQCRWPTTEKEADAIRYSMQQLDPDLHGAECVLRTDHLLHSPM